ncbi:hypothetical protein [Paracoccus sp. SSK6]
MDQQIHVVGQEEIVRAHALEIAYPDRPFRRISARKAQVIHFI